jgi:hypothetical protein
MLARISGLWRHHSGADDFSAELQSHLDMHIADNLRAGMTPDEVRRRAVIALGGVQQTKERYREARGVHWIDELRQDLRCAARTLVRNPGFAAPVIVTLALGIGANAAVFAVTYGILMRPLPYRDPSELVVLNLLFRDGGDLGFYPPTVASRLERLERVGDAAAYNVRDVTE